MGTTHDRRDGTKSSAFVAPDGEAYRLSQPDPAGTDEVAQEFEFDGVRLQVVAETHYKIRAHVTEIDKTVALVGHKVEAMALRIGFTVWVVLMVADKIRSLL